MVVQEKIPLGQGRESHTGFSGAVGKCVDTRSFQKNREIAFERLVKTKEFQKWLRIEAARLLGKISLDEEIAAIKTKIERLEELE